MRFPAVNPAANVLRSVFPAGKYTIGKSPNDPPLPSGCVLCRPARHGCRRAPAALAYAGQRRHRAAFVPSYCGGGLAVRAVRGERGFPHRTARDGLLRSGGGVRACRGGVRLARGGRGGAPPRRACRARHRRACRALRGGAVRPRAPRCRAPVSVADGGGGGNARYAPPPFVRLRGVARGAGYALRLPDGHGEGEMRRVFHARRRVRQVSRAVDARGRSRVVGLRRGGCRQHLLSGCFFPRFVLYYQKKAGEEL